MSDEIQDPLASGLAALRGGTVAGADPRGRLRFGGLIYLGGDLLVNVPAQVEAEVAAQEAGLAFEHDMAPWFGLEAKLGPGTGGAVELAVEALADRDAVADVFLRRTDAAGAAVDGPARTLTLGLPTPAVTTLLPPEAPGSDLRLVVLLRDPPASFLLTRLRLSAPGAAAATPTPDPTPDPAPRARKAKPGAGASADAGAAADAAPAARVPAAPDPKRVERPQPDPVGTGVVTLNFDFAFRDDRGDLILTGWSPDPGTGTGVLFDLAAVSPATGALIAQMIGRFTRPDLGHAPLGLVVRLRGLPGAVDWGEAVLVAPDGQRQTIDRRGIGDDADLVETAPDETLAAVLRAVAEGAIGALGPTACLHLTARAARSGWQMPAEAPALGMAVDQALLGPGGLGFASGWVLSRLPSARPVVGLVVAGGRMAPLGIVAGSLPKHGLDDYARRYHLTGRDGMAAAFRMPPEPGGGQARGTLLMLAADPELGPTLYTHPVEAAPDATVAAATLASLAQLLGLAERRTLLGAVAGGGAGDGAGGGAAHAPPALPDPGQCPTGQGTLLLLQPDTSAEDLRDILRRLLPALTAPVELRLVAAVTPPQVLAAGMAARAETGVALTLGEPLDRAGLSALDPAPGVEVVYGSGAGLFQLGLPAPAPGRASVLVHDPLAALAPDDAAPGAAEIAGAPFTLRLPGALLKAAIAAGARHPLTASGLIAAAMVPLEAAGRLSAARGGQPSFWRGEGETQAEAVLDAAIAEVTG